MKICKGTASSPGIAIGKILYYSRGEYRIRQYMVNNEKKELADFEKAKEQVIHRLEGMKKEKRSGEREARINLLKEKSFSRAVTSMIESQKVSAPYAVETTREEITMTFCMLENEGIRERIRNVRAVCSMLLTELGGNDPKIILDGEKVILVTENLMPEELLEMEQDKLLAVVTRQGSEISHTAITTKTMNIPSLFGVDVQDEWDRCMAIVDGYTGKIYIDPGDEFLSEYRIRQEEGDREREELLKLKDQEDVTLDGRHIGLYANIGSLQDLDSVLYYGAAGIGLLRSEFQYLGREHYPREKQLFEEYRHLAEVMGDRPAVIRTVDLGADKRAAYMNIPEEENPIMGNRGIRLSLDRHHMFKAQLRAIYRASAYGNLEIMFPMLTSLKELDLIDRYMEEVRSDLAADQVPFREIRRGIMVETPAAVMIAEELAERVDFLSLGTNDLTQYTLAMDRQNPLLKKKYDDHHPAVLRMIRMVVKAGHKKGCRVYICGEIAADPGLTETFLRMGVDALSVVPACILPVRNILRKTDLSIDLTKQEADSVQNC